MTIAVGAINRKEFYYGQKVKQTEVNAAFDGVEEGFRRLMADDGSYGVHKNPFVANAEGVITENSPTSTSVICQKFFARTKQGDRIERNVSSGSIDLTVDKNGAATDPASGKERYLTIFAVPKREESDPRTPKSGGTVNFESELGYAFEVEAGAEVTVAVPTNAVKPSSRVDAVVLADILVQNGFSSITDASSPLSPGVGEIDLLRVEKFTARGYRVEADEYMKINANSDSDRVWTSSEFFREQIPLAWGYVNSATPAFVDKSNMTSLVKNGTGDFTITIPDMLNTATESCVLVTPIAGGVARIATGNVQTGDKTKIDVKTFDAAGAAADINFHVILFGRLSL